MTKTRENEFDPKIRSGSIISVKGKEGSFVVSKLFSGTRELQHNQIGYLTNRNLRIKYCHGRNETSVSGLELVDGLPIDKIKGKKGIDKSK